MKVPLTPDIPVNTLAVATAWGKTGTWWIKWLDRPTSDSNQWIERENGPEYNYELG